MKSRSPTWPWKSPEQIQRERAAKAEKIERIAQREARRIEAKRIAAREQKTARYRKSIIRLVDARRRKCFRDLGTLMRKAVREYNVDMWELSGTDHKRKFVRIRHLIYRELAAMGHSPESIAHVAGRHPTTIRAAISAKGGR